MQYLSIEEFLVLSEELPVIDVRSEAEYLHAHIPGAHNIQLFNNKERAEIGLIYRLQGSETAITRGYELANPKFQLYIDQLKNLTSQKRILVYCWRGGMRSSSLAWLYEKAGYECFVLTKGYKAFRQHVLTSFSKEANIKVIGGKTGSGKTDILFELSERNAQVLDLEKYANHRGSAFGHLGQPDQPSCEQFENLLFGKWRNLDLSRPIWIEDESQQIGNVFVPKQLWTQMQKCAIFVIDIPMELRIERLIMEYACFNKENLITGFKSISKRIGLENLKKAVDYINNDDLKTACLIVLNYYDKTYLNSLQKRDAGLVNHLKFIKEDTGEIAEVLLKKVG